MYISYFLVACALLFLVAAHMPRLQLKSEKQPPNLEINIKSIQRTLDDIEAVIDKMVNVSVDAPQGTLAARNITPASTMNLRDEDVRSLLVGMAFYKPEQMDCRIGIFIQSASRFLRNTDIVLGVPEQSRSAASQVIARVAEPLAARGIKVKLWTVPATPRYPALQRWIWYSEVIYQHLNLSTHRGVVLADVKDVFFQGDPFPAVAAAVGVVVNEEYGGVPIRADVNNRGWMTNLHPEGGYADRAIICSGVVGGQMAAVLSLVECVLKLMRQRPDLEGHFGMDQGMLQFCVYESYPTRPHIEIRTSQNALFWHVGIYPAHYNFRSEDGVVFDGSSNWTAPIVHQFDRVDVLLPAIRNHYKSPCTSRF
eukprot:TRINITY_DN3113_c0_g1_i1.p1 TRINITY_DN3113_c0_g1~~TRINITY_DN3113_c0_g1_i1.p1  ORF type:complete len:378 (+),score=52.91 TRINITY_DN3113_c0_g1_i1:36-1136(+)